MQIYLVTHIRTTYDLARVDTHLLNTIQIPDKFCRTW